MLPPRQPFAFLPRLFAGGDALAGHREQILYRIAVIGVALLSPFIVYNFFVDRIPLGLAILATVAVLVLDAVAIHRGRKAPVPFALLLVPAAAAVALLLRAQAFYGVLWAYPAVLFCYFVLKRSRAVLVSLILLAGTTALVIYYVDMAMAIRVFASLLLTIAIVNVLLTVINDLHERLVAQTITDPLTGAYNRRHMETCLDEAIERYNRTTAPVVLLLIDIDHFKDINDRQGHAAGDAVLRMVVGLIGDRVRRLDRLFRIGGDEILLLLPDTDGPSARGVAEELCRLIANATLPGVPRVTASIGLAVLKHGQKMDDWMQEADAALYRAKERGRNRVAGLSTTVDG